MSLAPLRSALEEELSNSGAQALVVRNTFIQVELAAEERDDDAPMRYRSSPAKILAASFVTDDESDDESDEVASQASTLDPWSDLTESDVEEVSPSRRESMSSMSSEASSPGMPIRWADVDDATEELDSVSLQEQSVAVSAGSALHASGECKPCAWFWKPQGCKWGAECFYCHTCQASELRNRKKAKVDKFKSSSASGSC